MSAFIGVDWGSSNLRAWRLSAAGEIEASAEAPLGIGSVANGDFPALFREHVQLPLGAHLPVLMCGMIGSNLGWREAGYVACPTPLGRLARSAARVSETPAIRIVPGLSCAGLTNAPDLMRGEETQIMGWLARDRAHARGRHLLCLPGTHSKWALIRDGQVERFITAMTGELFALLSTQSILKVEAVDAFDADAFAAGVDAAGDGDSLSLRLFSARARIVAGGSPKQHAGAYLSGLLIGSEIAAAAGVVGQGTGETVSIVGAPLLRERYAAALRQKRWHVVEMDGAAAAVAGLTALVQEGALA